MTQKRKRFSPADHLPASTVDEVMAAFQKGGPNAIAWPACAPRCDHCNKRRYTYQLSDDFQCNDRLCSECLVRQAVAEKEPPPPAAAWPPTCPHCGRPLAEHFLGCC